MIADKRRPVLRRSPPVASSLRFWTLPSPDDPLFLLWCGSVAEIRCLAKWEPGSSINGTTRGTTNERFLGDHFKAGARKIRVICGIKS